MNSEVKTCVDARLDFFDQYYTIPNEMKNEVDSFIKDIKKLGSSCSDAKTFEEKFISEGLSDRFNAILPKCTPKQFKMTKEQKKNSMNVAKQIIKDNKSEIIKDTVSRAGERTFNKLKDDAIDKNRKRMIANDTFDDYSRATSVLNGRGISISGFFKNIFKKK